jgi:2-polyprenyl-3-methyl-5-hydroxy-6-metoxy-1,4-benzoquinol methylase
MIINYKNNCLSCNSKKRKIISKTGRNFTKLTTVICTGCGLLHSHPIPTQNDLDNFYKNLYRKQYKQTYRPQKRHTIRYAKGCLEIINEIFKYINKNEIKNKKFLDVGSGSGEVLYFAKKSGFNIMGIEPNTGYANFSKNDLSLNVINNSLEKINFKNEKYDVINLNQVLEHLPNPLNTLNMLMDLLNFDGLLIVTVPDIEAKLHSPNTRFHYAHIYNFNHLNLKSLFVKAGFQILNPETKSTKIYARKLKKVDNSGVFFDFKRNYEEIDEILKKSDFKNHYLSKKPYERFLKKLYSYPKEFLKVLLYKNHKEILDKTYQKYKHL